MRKTISIVAGLAMGCVVCSAHAAELSPWFGSNDQTPFQLDPDSMAAVNPAADVLQTGSVDKAPCPTTGCIHLPEPAIQPKTAEGTPQN
jgi:hypothetical protein